MSKITFRADDELVEQLEACDASKSEVMRRALRNHLEGVNDGSEASSADSPDSLDGIDATIADRIDDLIAERLDAALEQAGVYTRTEPSHTPDINVNVRLDGVTPEGSDASVTRETAEAGDADARKTTAGDAGETAQTRGDSPQTRRDTCASCGENVPSDHVYCPNCGEKRSHRAFCECGDEVRSDWAFCPGCGRRTPAADVLDRS